MKIIKSVSTTGAIALAVLLTHVASVMAGGDTVAVELPEPSMVGLLAIGVIGVIAIARLRK